MAASGSGMSVLLVAPWPVSHDPIRVGREGSLHRGSWYVPRSVSAADTLVRIRHLRHRHPPERI